jgi:hypothetical protein
MIVDDDVLEKEDLYILDRMKEFISTDGVSNFAAAKQLLILIERAVCTPSFCRVTSTKLVDCLATRRGWRQNDGEQQSGTPTTSPYSQI